MGILPRRTGFTILELLVAVVVVGILVALATPKIRRAVLRGEVTNARNAMANMYTTARLTAVQTGRGVALERTGSVVHIAAWPRLVSATSSTRDTIGAVIDLGDRHGVTVSGARTTIGINPKGLGGVSDTWVVKRAEFRDSIRVSNLGILQ